MTQLPNVALVAVGTEAFFGPTVLAVLESLKHVAPAETILFSDVDYEFAAPNARTVKIDAIRTKEQYSEFVIKKMLDYIPESISHILVIQHDGYVLDGNAWRDEFLQYDYIGAPWDYKDSRNVGNGGFSLRSRWLMFCVQNDPFITVLTPEDEIICRLYRHYLEQKYAVKFAPEQLAHKFSFEQHAPTQPTLGFHAHFHSPYKPVIVLRRSGAMGDIIMLEPVMEWFYKQGFIVVLDIPGDVYQLFENHHFQVHHISQLKEITPEMRVINFDMTYEVWPHMLVLDAYYRAAGVQMGTLRNPQLNFSKTDAGNLFGRYVVLHIDDTAMAHRNVHGVKWGEVVHELRNREYQVVQVGHAPAVSKLATKVYTNQRTLAHIISCAEAFIGIESGPAQIAVACGVRSLLFAGSVKVPLRYFNDEKITVLQNPCPIGKDGCYHKVVSVVGQPCEVDERWPPCISHTTDYVVHRINKFLL